MHLAFNFNNIHALKTFFEVLKNTSRPVPAAVPLPLCTSLRHHTLPSQLHSPNHPAAATPTPSPICPLAFIAAPPLVVGHALGAGHALGVGQAVLPSVFPSPVAFPLPPTGLSARTSENAMLVLLKHVVAFRGAMSAAWAKMMSTHFIHVHMFTISVAFHAKYNIHKKNPFCVENVESAFLH